MMSWRQIDGGQTCPRQNAVRRRDPILAKVASRLIIASAVCVHALVGSAVSAQSSVDAAPEEVPDPFLDIWDHAVRAMDKTYDDWNRHDDRMVESTEYAIEFLASIDPDSRRRLDTMLLMQADRDRSKYISRSESKRFLELQLGIRWETDDLLRHDDGRVVDFNAFLTMDSNRDSKLAGNEFVRAKAILQPLDQDDDQVVTVAEFSVADGPFLKNPIEAFRAADSNGDRQLDRKELTDSIGSGRQHLIATNLAAFDQDGNGKLSLTEYRISMLANYNYPWDAIPIDQNRDRRLSFKEFRFADRGLYQLQRRYYFHRLDRDGNGELSTEEFVFKTVTPNALHVVSRDSSKRDQIHIDDDYPICGSPDISPNGRQVLFDAKTNAHANQSVIRIVTIDGKDARDVCDGAMPSWSANGDRFACARGIGVASIWIMRLDGSEEKRIDQGWGARWSPDGKSIAYTKDNSLLVYDIATEKSRTLLRKGSHPYRHIHPALAWSPDSHSLLFRGRVDDSTQEISIVQLENAKLNRRYSTTEQLGDDLAWSPDGDSVLFPMEHADQEASFIYRLNVATQQPPTIDGLSGQAMFWKSVAFSRNGKLLVLVSNGESNANTRSGIGTQSGG